MATINYCFTVFVHISKKIMFKKYCFSFFLAKLIRFLFFAPQFFFSFEGSVRALGHEGRVDYFAMEAQIEICLVQMAPWSS